jgi:hypothetical protein
MSTGSDPQQLSSREPTDGSSSPTRHEKRAHRREVRAARRELLGHVAVRLFATCGIVAIGVAIAAIMVSGGSSGWIVGLVVSIVSVVMSAVLWSRQF